MEINKLGLSLKLFGGVGCDYGNNRYLDYVLGNLGLNYKYQANYSAPFSIYADYFDSNRKNDIVLSYYDFGKEYPVRGRQCSSEQIPGIQIVYKDYSSFAKASVEEIFGSENLRKSFHGKVETPRNDAGIGLTLIGDEKNNFAPLSLKQSGINIPHGSKKIKTLNPGQFRGFLAASNQGPLQFFHKH